MREVPEGHMEAFRPVSPLPHHAKMEWIRLLRESKTPRWEGQLMGLDDDFGECYCAVGLLGVALNVPRGLMRDKPTCSSCAHKRPRAQSN